MSKLTELVSQIKPFVLGWIGEATSTTETYAPSPHDIAGSHHTGSLADSQFPNALLRDGSRSLLGNLAVADTMTLDGVDLSVFKAAYDVHIGNASAHHNPVTIGTGGLSAKLGLATQVLTLAAINHSDLSSIDSNQHIDHTTVTLTAGDGLTGGGTIAANRSFAVGAGNGISVTADAVAVNASTGLTFSGGALVHATGDNGDLHTNYPEHDVAETITAAWTHQADLITRLLRPELTDTYDIGTSTYWYSQQFVSQINAAVFAEQQIVLMGGWLYIPKDAGTFAAEVGSAATTIDFGKAMTVGDFVLVKAYDKSATVKAEYILVGSLVTGTTYNVTRDLAGAHTTDPNWAAGVPFAVLGQSGNGRIELNAYDTPRVQIIQQGAAYNAQTELVRLGDLNGNWGYSAQTYGLALGEYAASKANLTWDPTNGLRLRTYSTTVIQLDNAGNATITNKLRMPDSTSAITIGATPPTAYNAGTGIWLDRTGLFALNAGTYQVKIDATDGKLYAGAGDVCISNDGIQLLTGTGTPNSISWATGGTVSSYIRTHVDALNNIVGIANNAVSGTSGYISLLAMDADYTQNNLLLGSGYAILTKDLRVVQGLYVGADSDPGTGDIIATADGRLGGGLSIGSTATDPGTGDVIATADARLGGGLSVGSTATNPATGNIEMTGSIGGSTPYHVGLYRSAALSHTSTGNWQAITWDAEAWDSMACFTPSASTVTPDIAGYYFISARVTFAASATGTRALRILKNGSEIARGTCNPVNASNLAIGLATTEAQANGTTDYYSVEAYQDSGGNLAYTAGGIYMQLIIFRIA